MAIKMDGHTITSLQLKASDGSEVTKQLTEEGTIPTPTETLNINTNGERDVTNYKKVNVQVEGGGELPELTNPASASDILSGKEAIDGNGAKLVGTCTFDADTSDADATASDIAEGKTAYVNGAKLTGTASGGGGAAYHHGTMQIDSKVNTMSIPVDISTYDCYFIQLIVKRTGVGSGNEVTWDDAPTVPAVSSSSLRIVPAYQCVKGIQQNVQINNDGTLAWVKNDVFRELCYLYKGGTAHIVNNAGTATVDDTAVTIGNIGTNCYFGADGYAIEYEYDIFAFNAN